MKMRTVIAVVFLLLAGLAAPAAAANQGKAFTLSPMVGGHVFEGDLEIDDDVTLGLGFGYNYDPRWGTELFFTYTPAEAEGPGNPDVDAYTYLLNVLHHFSPERSLVPYLTVGIGGISYDREGESNDHSLAVGYGAGLKWFLNDWLALRGDLRHLIGFDQGFDEWSQTDHNLLATVGVSMQFGAPEPAPAPVAAPAPAEPTPPAAVTAPPVAPAPAPVLDSDQDGVPDDRDKCPNTPRGVFVDDRGCPISLNLHIEFDFDKAEIKPEHAGELKKAADFIREHPSPKVLIAGHTDSIGTPSYNKELSQRRAAAVRQYLIDQYGMDADQLVARGYGDTRPIATNETPEGRQQNRRTEIICCVLIPE